MQLLSHKQKSELTKLLHEHKNTILHASTTERISLREATDELSTLDNHPADTATELYEREKDFALQHHAEEQLEKIEHAMKELATGDYGICQECHTSIPYDRLLAVPYTSFCIEHAEQSGEPNILPQINNDRFWNAGNNNRDDSLDLVTRYGNSDTPSDLDGDPAAYNEEEQLYAAIDELYITPHAQLTSPVSQQAIENERKNDYSE